LRSSSKKLSIEQLPGKSPMFGLENTSWFEKSRSPSSIRLSKLPPNEMLDLVKGKPIYDFEVDQDENLSPIIPIDGN
jgi:hypothetical protein